MSNIRTFIAVEVSPEVRTVARKQMHALSAAGFDYRWSDPDTMHLTLKFLGNIRDQEVPDVCRIVEESVRNSPPISVLVKGLGAFPSLDRPRVIWLGIDQGYDELRTLQQAVDEGLRALGFPIERQDFRPHLTLGRLASGVRCAANYREYAERYRDTIFGGFEIDAVIVFASYLERSGAVHTPMATIELAG